MAVRVDDGEQPLSPGDGPLFDGRVDLGDGLSLIGGEAIDAPPEAVWSDPRERSGDPNVLVDMFLGTPR